MMGTKLRIQKAQSMVMVVTREREGARKGVRAGGQGRGGWKEEGGGEVKGVRGPALGRVEGAGGRSREEEGGRAGLSVVNE